MKRLAKFFEAPAGISTLAAGEERSRIIIITTHNEIASYDAIITIGYNDKNI